MTRETDTSTEVETDNAPPHEADTPDEWDYFDPDEDQDTEVSQDEGTDDEAEAEDEAETEDETEEQAEDEAEEDADEQSDDETTPELVKLHDGTEVTFEELTKGYLRQADYTRKQQEVSNERKSVAENAERIERITSTFTDYLVSMMPPEPDTALAMSDPNKFTQQKAQYDAALSKVQELFKLAEEPKEVRGQFSKEDHEKLKSSEMTKLAEALPKTATREGQESFFKEIKDVAAEVGFTPDVLEKVIDHRVFLLADLAKDGLAARKARVKAKEKAQKAPPATPRKPGQPAKKANRNADAMRKLSRTGSIHDALSIDFD